MVEKLKADMIQAMKEKDKERLTVIRMVKAAMDLEHIDRKREINDELLIDVVSKQVKMREESILEFEKGNREDLIEKTKKEIEKSGLSANDCITLCVEHSWGGFNAEWVERETLTQHQTTHTTHSNEDDWQL